MSGIVTQAGMRGGGLRPINPLDLDPILFLDPTDGPLAVGGSPAVTGDPVATWENQSTHASPVTDATQTTAVSQPLYMDPGDQQGLVLPGITTEGRASVPSSPALMGFDDFTLQVDYISLIDWTPSLSKHLLAKYDANASNISYLLYLSTAGLLSLLVRVGGVNRTAIATTGVNLSDGATVALRAVRSGGDVFFYMDSGTGFSQIGDSRVMSGGTMDDSSVQVMVGNSVGGSRRVTGSIGRARIWNTATPDISTPVLDIDFATDATPGARSFDAASGQTVTVEGRAAIMDSPAVSYDGVDDVMSVTLPNAVSGATMIVGGSLGILAVEVSLDAGVNTIDEIGYNSGNSFPAGTSTSFCLFDRELTVAEKEGVKLWFVTERGSVDGFSQTSYFKFFKGRKLVGVFPEITVSEASLFSEMFRECVGLTEMGPYTFNDSIPNNWDHLVHGLNLLERFEVVGVPVVTAASYSFRSCSSLPEFVKFNMRPAGCTSTSVYEHNSIPTTFYWADFAAASGFYNFWKGCLNLTNFPASMFDNCSTSNYTNAFNDCNLNQQSTDNILISIDASGVSNGTLGMTGANNSAPSSTGQVAFDSLVAKGWTITKDWP